MRKPVEAKKSASSPETALPSAPNMNSNKNGATASSVGTAARPTAKPNRKSVRPSGQANASAKLRSQTVKAPAGAKPTRPARTPGETTKSPDAKASPPAPPAASVNKKMQTTGVRPQVKQTPAPAGGSRQVRQPASSHPAGSMRPSAPPTKQANVGVAAKTSGSQQPLSQSVARELMSTVTSQIQQIAVQQAKKSTKGRKRYRAISARRQSRVFSVVITGMVVCLIAGIVCSVIPWQYTGFKVLPSYAEAGDTPCPVEGTKMTSPEGVQVTVLNGTSTAGLATSVGETLESLGYTLAGVDNSPSSYRGTIQIEAGPNGVDDAYTLAMYLTGAEVEETGVSIILNETQSNSLTVILGDSFTGITDEGIAAAQAYTDDLVAFSEDCKIMDTTTITE